MAVLAGLVVSAALLALGASCGHDFDFHLQSWLAVRSAWTHGVLAPHWVPGANYGAGEPRFLFYPPLTWVLGGALGFAMPWSWVPAAFTGLCFAGAAWGMFRLARRYVEPAQAGLAALLYAFSPYLLFTGLERTAYGELMAATLLPLLLQTMLRPVLPLVRTAVLVALLWYTNAPSAVMGCYLLLMACTWQAVAVRQKQPLVRGAGALALGGLLAADYLIPAWYEQRWVTIAHAIDPGMRVQDSFLFGHTGIAYHDEVLHTASWLAVLTLGAGLLAGPLARREAGRKSPVLFLTAALSLILLLQLPWSLPVWHLLPELNFLQFPWRFLLPSSAIAALLIALALPRRGHRLLWSACAVLWVAGMTGWATHRLYQPCDDEDRVSAQIALPTGGGFEGTDEYAPTGSDNGAIQQGLPLVRLLRAPGDDPGNDDLIPNPDWKSAPEQTVAGDVKQTCHPAEGLCVAVTPAADAWAVLRLERWPGWTVLRNGEPCGTACLARADGLIAVATPAHSTTSITVTPHTTPDVEAARAISLLALLGMALWSRRSAIMKRT